MHRRTSEASARAISLLAGSLRGAGGMDAAALKVAEKYVEVSVDTYNPRVWLCAAVCIALCLYAVGPWMLSP